MSNVTAVPIKPTKRSVIVWLVLGLIVALAAATALAVRGTGQVVAERGDNAQFLDWNKRQPGVVELPSGLQYQVLKPGTGEAKPTDADVTLVTYKGALRDGSVFDQSERPSPMPVAGVVPGFSEGLKQMTKGSQYRFWIKPELGYGERTPDPQKLPPNSLLVFDVTLLDFLPQQVIQQMQMQQMMRQQQGGAPGGAPPGMPAQ